MKIFYYLYYSMSCIFIRGNISNVKRIVTYLAIYIPTAIYIETILNLTGCERYIYQNLWKSEFSVAIIPALIAFILFYQLWSYNPSNVGDDVIAYFKLTRVKFRSMDILVGVIYIVFSLAQAFFVPFVEYR